MKRFKRRHKRKQGLVLLDVALRDKPEEKERAAIINISPDGCAFETPVEFKKESLVALRFVFNNDKVYIIKGRIKRVHAKRGGAYVHGVQFKKSGILEKIKRRKIIKKLS
ncbi:MAG: PilZ domain-containing protein [Elusimicrobiota bacterium]